MTSQPKAPNTTKMKTPSQFRSAPSFSRTAFRWRPFVVQPKAMCWITTYGSLTWPAPHPTPTGRSHRLLRSRSRNSHFCRPHIPGPDPARQPPARLHHRGRSRLRHHPRLGPRSHPVLGSAAARPHGEDWASLPVHVRHLGGASRTGGLSSDCTGTQPSPSGLHDAGESHTNITIPLNQVCRVNRCWTRHASIRHLRLLCAFFPSPPLSPSLLLSISLLALSPSPASMLDVPLTVPLSLLAPFPSPASMCHLQPELLLLPRHRLCHGALERGSSCARQQMHRDPRLSGREQRGDAPHGHRGTHNRSVSHCPGSPS